MSEEDQDKEAKELTEQEKCQKFVDSWLFPDHKDNTEEERKAHELMDIWYKEWRASPQRWSGLKSIPNISVPEGQEALLQAWNRRKQWDPEPIKEEQRREYLKQQEKERAEQAEKVRKKQQAELTFRLSQVPLMGKDEIGLKFVELQVEALKCFIQYVKDIQYRLPLHMSVKPYADIAKHLRRTIALVSLTNSMDDTWITRYGREVESIKNEVIQIDKNVKIRRKQMIYL